MVRPLLLVGQPLLAPLLPVLRADYDVLTLWAQPDAAALFAHSLSMLAAAFGATQPELAAFKNECAISAISAISAITSAQSAQERVRNQRK